MTRARLSGLAAAAVRRRMIWRGVGMAGLGASLQSNVSRRQNLLGSIQAFQSELYHAVDGLAKGAEIRDNAYAYADTMARMLSTLGDQQNEINLQAGGKAAEYVVKMMDSYDKLLASRKAMWNADLNDPSGAASRSLAQQEWQQAQANTVAAAERVAFWEKVTNVDNPFSPVGILSTIKRYAVAFLVIGGVVLAAPVLFPAIGKMIGQARTPQPVKPNRRK